MFSGGLDFGGIMRNPVLLATFALAVPCWIIAFAGQCAVQAQFKGDVGTVWFGIWTQLFVIVFFLLAALSDGVIHYRLQLSIFTAISVIYAVTGTNNGIYDKSGAKIAMAVGWLILAIIDVVWLLYLTSEDGTFLGDILGSNWGGSSYGGARRSAQMTDMGGYGAESVGLRNGAADRGMVSHDLGTTNGRYMMDNAYASTPMNGGMTGGMGASPAKAPQMGAPAPVREVMDTHSMSGQSGQSGPGGEPQFRHKARANYAYSASPDDPNEVSFAKGDVLDVVDTTGKWYQVRTPAGQVGIAPSNYLTLL